MLKALLERYLKELSNTFQCAYFCFGNREPFPVPPNSEIPFLFITSKENAEDVKKYSVSIDDAQLGGEGTFNFSFSQIAITERTSLFDKYSGEITNENDSLKKYRGGTGDGSLF